MNLQAAALIRLRERGIRAAQVAAVAGGAEVFIRQRREVQ